LQAARRTTPDFPLPSRNFLVVRRILLAVLAASILAPCVFLACYGVFDYQNRLAQADDVADRLSRVAEEQAVKVLDLNRQMCAQIVRLLDDSDDAHTQSTEANLHRRLAEIDAEIPQVAAVSVVGDDGRLLASSRWYPVPPIYIDEREDFRSARAVAPKPYYSLPLKGKIAGTSVFNTIVGRMAVDGTFLGAVSVSLKTDYFSKFYAELVAGDPALTIGLYRRDAHILARDPAARANVSPAPDTPFAQALRNNDAYGRIRMTSTVDGADRVLSFRRVANYPLYVSAGYATAVVWQQWWNHFLLIAAVSIVLSAAIWLLVAYSLVRLKTERTIWERWQSEIGLRLSAEASSRHLHRMGALGNLVANVAHDFNNLLMVVTANMELMRRKRYNNVENEVRAVERASDGAKALARRLLSVARKQPLHQEPVDLATWLPGADPMIRTALGSHVALVTQVPPDVWRILVDPTELEFAILNIAVNAKDAIRSDGRFVIRCANVRLKDNDIGVTGSEYVVLTFSDNGIGMPEEVVSHAFEPLFTTKAQGVGTGLGLAQVMAACEQAGGTARIDSVMGRGTTVRMYFPRYTGNGRTKPQRVETIRAATPAGGSVLLVEDNAEVAAGVAAVLDVLGCRVHVELSADGALDLLKGDAAFDLILSDIQMPGANNGIDLAEQVLKLRPTQRIALMTGYADGLERARATGVTILAKPFNIDDLQALLVEVEH
jgi:signal transduction histidine kinase/cell division protein FtsB